MSDCIIYDFAEQWKPVVGYEGMYEVSNAGRVRSIDRYIKSARGEGRCLLRGKVLRTQDNKGLLYLGLCKNGRGKTHAVHQLVLTAFVGPRPDGMEGCHGNGNGSDNRLSNLRWDTHKSNGEDMVRHGTSVKGDRNGSARLTRDDIGAIRLRCSAGENQGAIADKYGVSRSHISDIHRRKTWRNV